MSLQARPSPQIQERLQQQQIRQLPSRGVSEAAHVGRWHLEQWSIAPSVPAQHFQMQRTPPIGNDRVPAVPMEQQTAPNRSTVIETDQGWTCLAPPRRPQETERLLNTTALCPRSSTCERNSPEEPAILRNIESTRPPETAERRDLAH